MAQRKKRLPVGIRILLIVLLLALLALGGFFGYKAFAARRTPAVAATPQPVETAAPTATPAPTPAPTPTPMPAPTPTPGPQEVAEFTVPADRDVVIRSYYNVSETVDNEIREITHETVKPDVFEEVLQFIHGGGYDPIWFEDLGDLGGYDRPVILTFDGAYEGVYTDVLPLIQKFNTKITVFVWPDDIGTAGHLTASQLDTLVSSGLVSLQVGAPPYSDYATPMDQTELLSQLRSARNKIGEISGEYPIAFAYPAGSVNRDAIEAASEVFRFCVRRSALRAMNTTDDDFSIIYRYTVEKETQPYLIEYWLEKLD